MTQWHQQHIKTITFPNTDHTHCLDYATEAWCPLLTHAKTHIWQFMTFIPYYMTPVEKRDEIVIYDTEVFHLIILKSVINMIDDIIIRGQHNHGETICRQRTFIRIPSFQVERRLIDSILMLTSRRKTSRSSSLRCVCIAKALSVQSGRPTSCCRCCWM